MWKESGADTWNFFKGVPQKGKLIGTYTTKAGSTFVIPKDCIADLTFNVWTQSGSNTANHNAYISDGTKTINVAYIPEGMGGAARNVVLYGGYTASSTNYWVSYAHLSVTWNLYEIE